MVSQESGILSLPSTALPDIDVEVIIPPEAGRVSPPSLIEDQGHLPQSSRPFSAPHVKAVRAQPLGDPTSSSFRRWKIFVLGKFARFGVQCNRQGRVPSGVHTVIGAGCDWRRWVY